ncbi:hypothetical protein BN8_00827 [Fibrisoma limi BUZ 3]|uniref:Uncharacterized protein n=1 Tax=Fibrisoma limi BUZ 3 TaxID=1185876 RepID=I2GD97_9BACT|nr:hypothetical protein [Fibrisoma limi]CCH51871.1 hypothetical protein BN8_00827 [Fibrisoma limi BUZ 3]
MAHHDQKIQTMIDDTLHTLGGGAPATSPEHGVNLVEDWIAIVRTNVNTQWVAEPLAKLRDALDSNNIREVERVMRDLAGQTEDLANNAAEGQNKQELRNLATAIRDFAQGMAK